MDNEATIADTAPKLAWVVFTQTPTGWSEAVKITDHEDADRTVQENPKLFRKSGPIVLPAWSA